MNPIKYKVRVYARVLSPDAAFGEDKYRLQLSGNDLAKALARMFELKKAGIECVRLEWCGEI